MAGSGRPRIDGPGATFSFSIPQRISQCCRRPGPAGTIETVPLTRAGERGGEPVTANRSLVAVVDDDESVRESPPTCCRFGFAAAPSRSAGRVPGLRLRKPDQLSRARHRHAWYELAPICNGTELIRAEIPIVVTSRIAHEMRSGVPTPAAKQGAVERRFKPFSETAGFRGAQCRLRVS